MRIFRHLTAHGWRRRAPLFLAALLATLALLLVSPAPGSVQTNSVLLSNSGQSYDDYNDVSSTVMAQPFRTGAHAGGYSLGQVKIEGDNSSSSLPTVTLRATNGDGSPSSPALATFSNPSSWTTGLNVFEAPAGTFLQPDTTYFIHIESSATIRVDSVATLNKDGSSKSDWSFKRVWYLTSGTWTESSSLLIEATPSTGAEVDETTTVAADVGPAPDKVPTASAGRPVDKSVIIQPELSPHSHGSSLPEPYPTPDHDLDQTAPAESKAGCPPSTGYFLTPRGEENSADSACHDSAAGVYPAGISADSGPADDPEQSDPEQTDPVTGKPYTWQDGDRTLTVFLQPDQVLTDDGEIEETKGGRTTQGGSGQPVFRSNSGQLMTLPGGVLISLDPSWSQDAVDKFFAGNKIKPSRVSELDFLTNGFVIDTDPGFPSLTLANNLASQDGVLLSSPNWWTEISPDSTETPDDHGDTQETASDLQLGTPMEGAIETQGDVDFFKFELTGDADVIIRAASSLVVEGELYDSSGQLVDDGSPSRLLDGWDSFLILKRLDKGAYYLSATVEANLGEGYTGDYTISVSAVTEPGSTLGTAQSLALGEIAGGTIDPEGSTDYFSITLAQSTHLIVHAVSEPDEYIDVGGTLLDSSGNPVAANLREKHLPGPMGFFLQDTLSAGTYYIEVVRKWDGGTGSYAILALEDTEYGDFLNGCSAVSTSYSDPLFGCQWHLDNTGQGQGTSGEDINVTPVWAEGNMGEGITVAVVDDGLDPDHEDLRGNVNTAMSHDYQGGSQLLRPDETHGTQVAGIIAGRDNNLGMRGVAPRATLYSYNFLAVQATLKNLVDALTRNMDTVAVSNNSWGPYSRNAYSLMPAFYELALDAGVSRGYGGKGVFYVFSAGNEGVGWGYSNHDELGNYYAVTSVCAVNDQGVRSLYSERGSNLWVCAPSSDDRTLRPDRQQISTTANYSRYTGRFGGTSAAAPQVAGVAALVRKANETLTWRDVKLILAASARQNHPTDPDWDQNPNSAWETGALEYGSTSERYSFSHNYGFGVVDAEAAVDLAEEWTNLPPMKIARGASGQVNLAIPDTPTTGEPTSVTSAIAMDSYVEFVEFVEVKVEFTHESYRDLEIELVSPAGAVSILSVPTTTPRPFDWNGAFRFGSARHLGEAGAGTWTLRIKDWTKDNDGTLKSWNLRIFGHGTLPGAPAVESVTIDGSTLSVSWDAPDDPGGSAITDYELRYIKSDASDKGDDNWTVVDAWDSGNLAYIVTGLGSGVSYDVQMRASNSQGSGRWSDTFVASQTPGAPVIATVIGDGHRTLKVSWNAPVYSGTSEVTAYDIRHIPSNRVDKADDRWDVIDDAWTSGNLEHWIADLAAEEHDVQVRAVNSSGEGPWSGTRTGESLLIGPSPPRILGSPAAGNGTLTIDWWEPYYPGVSKVIIYDLRYTKFPADYSDYSTWTLLDGISPSSGISPSGGLQYTITGLENGVLYVMMMRARNFDSYGDWTVPVFAFPWPPDNTPATGAPTISGTVQVGETLTADVSGIADADGLTNAIFTYQWLADDADIPGATGSSYILADTDEGKAITVSVSFTDDAGNEETITSATTDAVVAKPNAPATGAPAVTGTAQVGETLTADTSGISDEDGLTDTIFSYQWIANDGSVDADIAGATDDTYTPAEADEGGAISVRVSFTDDRGNDETLISAATAAVAARPNSPATGLPTISGTAQVGEALTADTSGISDEDGLTDTIFSYQWTANDGSVDADIAGATDDTYTPAEADEGGAIKVRVSFTDDRGNDETLISAATAAVVAPKPNTPATGSPTIGGTARVGETLTADASGIADEDGLDNATFGYQWVADDADISGATDATYTLAEADEGKAISVRVSFTDDAGNGEGLTSAATAAVDARPNTPATGQPTISGTAQVGETLTADMSAIADEDGLTNATISYQWLADDADIEGATDTNYTLAEADEGKAIKPESTEGHRWTA